jgi:type VII secretion protein EccB
VATRRDQLHSYQFMTQRVISAFVMRETDPAQSPLRRGIGALFGGMMVALLIAAGFGIVGVLTRVGGDQWQADGSVVIERETGASFVYLSGRLHPALNFASAKLAAGRPSPEVFKVASAALSAVPRGVTVGIPGAPTSLPAAGARVGLPWTVCALPGSTASGGNVSRVVLAVAAAPTGGTALGQHAMLVKDASRGMTFLLWHGRRHLVQDSRVTVQALFGAVTATPVGTAWLNALPVGVDIASIAVSGRGSASSEVPGRKVGDVLVTQTGSGRQFYLVLSDGLAPITPLQEAVLRARYAQQPVEVSVVDATSAPASARVTGATGDPQPPATPPELVTADAGEPLCAVTVAEGDVPEIRAGGAVPGVTGAVPTGSTSAAGRPLADAVLVPGGHIAIVRVPGSGGFALVTDLGVRHAVPSTEALALLGYTPAMAVDVPTALIARIPAGVTLDPAAATRPAAATG